jgi:hypothetical protein
MSEKMTSQNELTEIKLVPYNKPLIWIGLYHLARIIYNLSQII